MDVSIGSPTIRFTAVVLASLLCIVALREPFTWRYELGVILVVTGVLLIVFRKLTGSLSHHAAGGMLRQPHNVIQAADTVIPSANAPTS